MRVFLTITFLFFYGLVFGQQVFYKMPNGKIIDSLTYEKVKLNLSKNGKIEERIVLKTNRGDSIIITPKITVLTQLDANGNYVDPYREQKKLIGSRFPIELFKNDSSKPYESEFLKGKPTLINFWFTSCIPCVAEIALLSEIKKESKNKFNFIAITFEGEKVVNAFLKKTEFSFTHILNGKNGIDKLRLTSYPTNLLLDKDGIVIDVYGEITNSKSIIISALESLL